MTPTDLLMAAGVLAFAGFFAFLGYVLGCKVTTRRHLPVLLAAAAKPTPAHLGNTVARQPRRPDDT